MTITPLRFAPQLSELAFAVPRLSQGSITVIGDVMLDRYLYGTARRISPEAPVPIITVEREAVMPGGAGNVVRGLTTFGAATAFISVVGDDEAGATLTGLIGAQPGVEPWLLVEGGRTTTLKVRYVAEGQQLLRADHEQNNAISERIAAQLLRIATDAMAATSVTVLSDYAKGVIGKTTAPTLIDAARKLGRTVIVDPKGTDYSRYSGATIITPNRTELGLASGMPVKTEQEIIAAAEWLRHAHGFGAVLVTRAEDGMTLLDATGASNFRAEAAEVFDVSGAGDTVIATLAAGLAAGLQLPVAARLANIAAGVVVGKVGTATVRQEEILAALSAEGGALRKIVRRDAALEHVERWRRRGWKVGFTNGCFDLLHPGHVHLLEQARGACDRLIVGLNSDASVRRLKGAGRPVQPEAARAAVLASLAAVDLVAIFDEDTPLELIRAIRPDLLIKGADYTHETVVGANEVEKWGGRVMLADILPGHSTTATLARLRG